MFRTEILLDESPLSIDQKSHFLFLGSCFAENIGRKLTDRKLSVNINPAGIAFNPGSVADHILNVPFHTINDRDIWHSLQHHSSLSAESEGELLQNIDKADQSVRNSLKKASLLTISFGTAFYYRHKKTEQRVANCHKLPSSEFDKNMMTSNEIILCWNEVIEHLSSINPDIQIVFTVSPVRHIKDGLIENNRSKSRLLEAVHKLVDAHQHCRYFPSYEIMMDDLRDYRYYANDMLHPSDKAVEYIFEKWKRVYCDAEFIEFLDDMEKYQKALQHQSRFGFGEDHDRHQEYLRKERIRLGELYPGFDFAQPDM